jgi:hypothetical protein
VPDDFEDFDEDNLRLDPLEEGMDPPEHWEQADRFGNTEREMREGEDLEHRLRQEEPDVAPDDVAGDDTEESADPVEPTPPAVRDGVSADVAGGSVAEEIRTPRDRAR